MNTRRLGSREEGGYVLMGLLVLAGICLMVTASLLNSSMSSSSTRYVVNKNHDNYYEVEQSINKVVAWLQHNSKTLVSAFSAANFNNNFDISAPSVGTNQGSYFQVPTLVKMKSTTNSVMLTNDSYFGTAAFPMVTHIDTGTSFNPVSAFQSADLGGASVRVLLIWSRLTDGSYEPMFRVDAITGGSPARGIHGINYAKSQLVTTNNSPGFYGRDALSSQNPNNECNSYQYTWDGTRYVRGAARSNCVVMSNSAMNLGARVNGNAYTLLSNGISYGTHGAVSGTKCHGATCHAYSLPTFDSWTTKCGGVILGNMALFSGDRVANITLSSGDTELTQCYRDITVASNRTLTLNTPNKPYYFRNINLQNNSNSQIRFANIGANDKYIIYAESFSGNMINGNQFPSLTTTGVQLAPRQVELNLTGSAGFTMNGNANFNVVVTAPNASMSILGNMTFNGAVRAASLAFNGNALMNYDESLGGAPILSDVRFSLFKASQRYR